MKKLLKKVLGLYSKMDITIAFEYGLILSETAHKQKIKLTGELIEYAEEVIIKEATNLSTDDFAIGLPYNVGFILETYNNKTTENTTNQ